ncbi:MAG: energy transducer TonB [Candidatus Acidiferrales bacterium]
MTLFPLVRRILAAAGVLLLVVSAKSDEATTYPEPEDATVKNGVFQADYFGLRYPLPAGWSEDLKGPEPSDTGYYSLAALKPEGEMIATMQISAQDNFFVSDLAGTATDFLAGMKQHLDPSLSAHGAIASVELGGLHFARLDYSGAGLNHSVFATEIRCHTVIFSITSGSKEAIDGLTQSLKKISFSAEGRQATASQTTAPKAGWPVCIRDDAYAGHIVRKVDPVIIGPRYASVPVRLIIGADGKIEHIHAISGYPEQIKSVTDALSRWEFKPYIVDGNPVEVETGLLFQFPKAPQQQSPRR